MMRVIARYVRLVSALGLIFLYATGFAQQTAPGKTQIYIVHADEWFYEEGDSTVVDQLRGNVNVRYDSVFLFCDTAFIHGTILRAVGHTSLVQGDSLKIFSDTLTYNSETGQADLLGRVLLVNGRQRLRTDSLHYHTRTKVASYTTGAFLENLDTRMYSQRGDYHVREEIIYFKDSVRVQDPQFRLKADSLYYHVREHTAHFTGPTLIRQQRANLYCEEGYYNLVTQSGLFTRNAQFQDSTRQAQADEIYYQAKPERFILRGDGIYREGTRFVSGDTLDYATSAGDFRVRGNGFLQDGQQTIQAEGIDYNTRTERFRTLGRSNVQDGAQFLEADLITGTDSSELAMAIGHVIWRDTSANVILQCDSAAYQRAAGYFMAMGNPPLLMQMIDGDTLYLVADRIRAERAATEDSTRQIHAYHHVFIYKSDLQATCDSLAFSERDSLFQFFGDPVIWSDTSQFTADTIAIRMTDQAIDTIYLRRKGLILNTPDGQYFNQIKGRWITAGFADGELARMDVVGNAESVYYAREENGDYLGVNASICSEMVLFFADNQVLDIYYLREPESVMYPMDQVDHASLHLEGFRWRIPEKPLNLVDLIAKWHASQTQGEDPD